MQKPLHQLERITSKWVSAKSEELTGLPSFKTKICITTQVLHLVLLQWGISPSLHSNFRLNSTEKHFYNDSHSIPLMRMRIPNLHTSQIIPYTLFVPPPDHNHSQCAGLQLQCICWELYCVPNASTLCTPTRLMIRALAQVSFHYIVSGRLQNGGSLVRLVFSVSSCILIVMVPRLWGLSATDWILFGFNVHDCTVLLGDCLDLKFYRNHCMTDVIWAVLAELIDNGHCQLFVEHSSGFVCGWLGRSSHSSTCHVWCFFLSCLGLFCPACHL